MAEKTGGRIASRARRLLAPTIGFYVVVVLVIVLPLYLVVVTERTGSTTDPVDSPVWFLQAIVIAWSGFRLSTLYVGGKPSLIALTMWAYVYVFLGLAPLAQLLTGETPGSGSIGGDEAYTANVIVVVGGAAWEVGRWIGRRAGRPTMLAGSFHPPRSAALKPLGFNLTRLKWLTVFAVACTLYYIGSVGVGTLFLLRQERGEVVNQEFTGTATQIVAAFATVPLLVAVLGLIQARRSGAHVNLAVLLGLTSLLILVVNPISSSRFTLGVFYGSILIVTFGLADTARRFRLLTVLLLVGIIGLFPYADKFRNETSAVRSEQPSLVEQFSSKLDYDSYPQIALTARYVEANGHTMGRQALGAATAAVPRLWWPDKPLDTGIVLGQFAGYWFLSISAPLWAEAWIDGGYAWLMVVFALLGLLSWRLDRAYALAVRSGSGLWYAAVPTFALYQVMTLRGSFLQQTPRLVLLIVLFWFVAERRRPTSELSRDADVERAPGVEPPEAASSGSHSGRRERHGD